MGSLLVPEDCLECAILEIRHMYLNKSHVRSSIYKKDENGKEHFKQFFNRKLLLKDLPVCFKKFAKEFYELTPVDFKIKSEESSTLKKFKHSDL